MRPMSQGANDERSPSFKKGQEIQRRQTRRRDRKTERTNYESLIGLFERVSSFEPMKPFADELPSVQDAISRLPSWVVDVLSSPRAEPYEISCPSPSLCVTGGQTSDVDIYNGSRWTKPAVIDRGGGSSLDIRCPRIPSALSSTRMETF